MSRGQAVRRGGIFREKNHNNGTKTVLKTRVLIFTTRRRHQVCLTVLTATVCGDGNHVTGRGQAGRTPSPSVCPSRASNPWLGWGQSPPGFTPGCSNSPGGSSTGTGEPQSPPLRQFGGDRDPLGAPSRRVGGAGTCSFGAWPRCQPGFGWWWPRRWPRRWHGVGGSGVALQEGAVGEALGAEAALEALGAVGAHVDIEGALLGEAFAADAALEGADARVGHHVLQQVVTE